MMRPNFVRFVAFVVVVSVGKVYGQAVSLDSVHTFVNGVEGSMYSYNVPIGAVAKMQYTATFSYPGNPVRHFTKIRLLNRTNGNNLVIAEATATTFIPWNLTTLIDSPSVQMSAPSLPTNSISTRVEWYTVDDVNGVLQYNFLNADDNSGWFAYYPF